MTKEGPALAAKVRGTNKVRDARCVVDHLCGTAPTRAIASSISHFVLHDADLSADGFSASAVHTLCASLITCPTGRCAEHGQDCARVSQDAELDASRLVRPKACWEVRSENIVTRRSTRPWSLLMTTLFGGGSPRAARATEQLHVPRSCQQVQAQGDLHPRAVVRYGGP